MVESSIVGPINTDEAKFKDFQNIKAYHRTERDKFIKSLRFWQQEFTVKHEPFDYRQAKLDFEETQKINFEKGKKGLAKIEEDVVVENFDFKKYANIKRFKLEKEEDVIEQIIVDSVRVPTKTGTYKTYVSLEGHARYSVFTPFRTDKK
jgi:hypothetical protein